MAKGFIHVYTGDGKGKTTAAIGLAMRAAGQGKKVLMLQFLKSDLKEAGEILSAKKSGIEIITFKGQVSPLFDHTVKISELKKAVSESLEFTLDKIRADRYDLIILDEFNTLISSGYAGTSDTVNILKEKPEHLELIFTGRGAPEELIEQADYATEIRMIKHPFTKGVKARKGIEF